MALMNLTPQLKKQIVDFILVIQPNKNSLSHELGSIFYDYPLKQQFDTEGRNFPQFVGHVVDVTLRYGRLDKSQSDDNLDNHALVVLLRGLTESLGVNRQQRVEALVAELSRQNPQ
ncbi:MAG: hypothetical protein ACPG7F_07025 [Aggregatilineales bacterium]